MTARELHQIQLMKESMQRLVEKNEELEERLRSGGVQRSRDSNGNDLPTTTSKSLTVVEKEAMEDVFLSGLSWKVSRIEVSKKTTCLLEE